MRMMEPVQRKLIHLAKTQLGLSEDEYQQAIGAQTHAKKWSSKDLTYVEADGLINYFKTLGFVIVRKYHSPDRGNFRRTRGDRPKGKAPHNVFFLPSIEQMEMVETLAGKVRWRFEDGYLRWLSKYMRIQRITTAEQASKVIEGLKKLLEHQPQEPQEAREA